MKHGFVKVAAAAPALRIADPMFSPDLDLKAMFFTNRILQSFVRIAI